MNDIYQRIQVTNEQEDQSQIIACIAGIGSGRLANDLKLVNYFREIPVSYAAEVLTVENDSVEFLVNQIQAVAISQEKVTVLKSRHFPRDVVANVVYVNVEKSRIVLSNFSYALVRADRRMSVRVELSERVTASFQAGETSANGRLHDISLTGIAVTFNDDPDISLSQQGELSVFLPAGRVTVPASLLKVISIGQECRLIFEIEVDRASEALISQFIFKRQVEIIKELKDHPALGR